MRSPDLPFHSLEQRLRKTQAGLFLALSLPAVLLVCGWLQSGDSKGPQEGSGTNSVALPDKASTLPPSPLGLLKAPKDPAAYYKAYLQARALIDEGKPAQAEPL